MLTIFILCLSSVTAWYEGIYYNYDNTLDNVGDGTAGNYTQSGTFEGYVTGINGTAIDLETDNSQSVANISVAGTDIDKIRTVDFWIKPEVSPAFPIFFDIHGGSSNDRLIFFQESSAVTVINTVNGAGVTLVGGSISDGNWWHIVYTMGAGGMELFVNNISVDTDPSTQNPDLDFSILRTGYDTENAYYDGLVDNVFLSFTKYTGANVSDSYNNGSGMNFSVEAEPPGIPVVSINSPKDKVWNNSDPITVEFQSNEIGDCSLYVNETWTNTTSVLEDIENFLNFSATNVEEHFNVNITCNNTIGDHGSDNITVFVDTLKPTITLEPGNDISNDNSSGFSSGTLVGINVTFADTFLNDVLVNVTQNSDSSIKYQNENLSLNRVSFNVNTTLDTTGWAEGNYTLNLQATDDHTKALIRDYLPQIEPTEKYIEYYPPSGNFIKIETPESKDDIVSVNTIKLGDRYNFNYNFKTIKSSRTFRVYSYQKINYNPNREYPSFTVGKWDKGNWVDFNIDGLKKSNYKVNCPDPYMCDVTITSNLKNFNFNSIGGLNLINVSYIFAIDDTPPVITNAVNWSDSINSEGNFVRNITVYANATITDNIKVNDVYFVDTVQTDYNSSGDFPATKTISNVTFGSAPWNNITGDVYTIPGSIFTGFTLKHRQNVSWYFCANDTAGNSVCSDTKQFSVNNSFPKKPIQTLLTNNTVTGHKRPTFTFINATDIDMNDVGGWADPKENLTHRVVIANDSSFSAANILFNVTTNTGIFTTTSDLSNNTYYWKVTTDDNFRGFNESKVFEFEQRLFYDLGDGKINQSIVDNITTTNSTTFNIIIPKYSTVGNSTLDLTGNATNITVKVNNQQVYQNLSALNGTEPMLDINLNNNSVLQNCVSTCSNQNGTDCLCQLDIISDLNNGINYSTNVSYFPYSTSFQKGTFAELINLDYGLIVPRIPNSTDLSDVKAAFELNGIVSEPSKTIFGDRWEFNISVASDITSTANIPHHWIFNTTFTNSTVNHIVTNNDTQKITTPGVKNCADDSTNLTLLNVTLNDEATINLLDSDLDVSFESFRIGSVTNLLNQSFNLTSINNASFCADENITASFDIVFRYDSTGYTQRIYNFRDELTTLNTTLLPLYLSNNANLTNIFITLFNENSDRLEGYYVKADRFYTSLNEFKNVETVKSDINGETLFHLIPLLVEYRFRIFDPENNLVKIVEKTTVKSTSITITIPVEGGSFGDYQDAQKAITSLTFDNLTKQVTWQSQTTAYPQSCLSVTRITSGGLQLYNNCQAGEIVVDTYTITENTTGQTYEFRGYFIKSDGTLIGGAYLSHSERTIGNMFGAAGLLFSLLITVTLFMIGINKPSTAILLAGVGFVVSVWIGFVILAVETMILFILMLGYLIYKMKD